MNKVQVGASCIGWPMIDYGKVSEFLNHVKEVYNITKIIELPNIPYFWIDDVSKWFENQKINAYSMHLDKAIMNCNYYEQRMLFLCGKKTISKLKMQEVVAHPFDRIAEKKEIENYIKQLIGLKKHFSLEITNGCFNNQLQDYYDAGVNGFTVDLGHYVRIFGEDFCYLNRYPITHVHIRGYKAEAKYTRVCQSEELVKRFLHALMSRNYSGKIILEYPYPSYEALKEDLFFIEKFIGNTL